MTNFIIFFIVETRTDIAFATSVASWFAKNPGYQYTKVVKIILQYLIGSKKRKIMYDGQEKPLIEGYLDLDWAGNKKSWKSIFSFIFMLNRGLISWCFKKQAIVALLSTKVKYIAFILTAKKATWLRLLLTELGLL